MITIEKIKKLIVDPKYRMNVFIGIGLSRFMSDKTYLKMRYKQNVGRVLCLDNPITYTEKIQWLKLYDRKPEYTHLQDKYLVREYIARRIGEKHLIPLFGVWDKPEEIDFERLPDQFVLKCNHDCASVIICRDKSKLNFNNTRFKLMHCIKRDFWIDGREWAYKNIDRKIIAEKYMQNQDKTDLIDYKVFCFSGKAKMILIASGEAHTSMRRTDYFDLNFNRLPIRRGSMAGAEDTFNKPEELGELVALAEKIAENIPFIRVDFYIIDSHIYFGEVAFYPSSGFVEFVPYEWEREIGSWITLPSIH